MIFWVFASICRNFQEFLGIFIIYWCIYISKTTLWKFWKLSTEPRGWVYLVFSFISIHLLTLRSEYFRIERIFPLLRSDERLLARSCSRRASRVRRQRRRSRIRRRPLVIRVDDRFQLGISPPRRRLKRRRRRRRRRVWGFLLIFIFCYGVEIDPARCVHFQPL